jgi:hypothetical protein
MHAVEIPRQHSSASLSVAIDLGWVGTTIQPFMVDTIFVSWMDGWRENRYGNHVHFHICAFAYFLGDYLPFVLHF